MRAAELGRVTHTTAGGGGGEGVAALGGSKFNVFGRARTLLIIIGCTKNSSLPLSLMGQCITLLKASPEVLVKGKIDPLPSVLLKKRC